MQIPKFIILYFFKNHAYLYPQLKVKIAGAELKLFTEPNSDSLLY